jgi:hypothetical protein
MNRRRHNVQVHFLAVTGLTAGHDEIDEVLLCGGKGGKCVAADNIGPSDVRKASSQ